MIILDNFDSWYADRGSPTKFVDLFGKPRQFPRWARKGWKQTLLTFLGLLGEKSPVSPYGPYMPLNLRKVQESWRRAFEASIAFHYSLKRFQDDPTGNHDEDLLSTESGKQWIETLRNEVLSDRKTVSIFLYNVNRRVLALFMEHRIAAAEAQIYILRLFLWAAAHFCENSSESGNKNPAPSG